jgi:hypothetical protein
METRVLLSAYKIQPRLLGRPPRSGNFLGSISFSPGTDRRERVLRRTGLPEACQDACRTVIPSSVSVGRAGDMLAGGSARRAAGSSRSGCE